MSLFFPLGDRRNVADDGHDLVRFIAKRHAVAHVVGRRDLVGILSRACIDNDVLPLANASLSKFPGKNILRVGQRIHDEPVYAIEDRCAAAGCEHVAISVVEAWIRRFNDGETFFCVIIALYILRALSPTSWLITWA